MAGERILIVEDERAVARGLEYGLAAEGFEVMWAATGGQALALAREKDPQLVLLDLRLPDISGFDVCRRMRADGMKQPILMLTACDEDVDKVLGLELGADDYVVKPFNLREVVARMRALLRRSYGELAAEAPTNRLAFGDLVIDLERMRVTRADRLVDLTPIEFRLLRYLASNPDRPFTRSEIIGAVWGFESEIGYDRTVDVHVRHLRQKLEEDPADPRWIVTVRGVGYRFAR